MHWVTGVHSLPYQCVFSVMSHNSLGLQCVDVNMLAQEHFLMGAKNFTMNILIGVLVGHADKKTGVCIYIFTI